MPCRYDETPQEIAEAAAKSKARRDRELNRVTNLLCQVVKALKSDEHETFEDMARAISDIPGLIAWAAEHEKRDKKT